MKRLLVLLFAAAITVAQTGGQIVKDPVPNPTPPTPIVCTRLVNSSGAFVGWGAAQPPTYSFKFQITGGTPPYHAVLNGWIPFGLTFNGNTATLSGTPDCPKIMLQVSLAPPSAVRVLIADKVVKRRGL